MLATGLVELGAGGPGPAAKELAVRGAFWLTRYSALQKSSRRDTRFAEELLEDVCTSDHGLRVLHRAITDGRAGTIPRRVREDGSILTTADGSTQPMDDGWLRETFPPRADEPVATGGGAEPDWTPEEELRTRIYSIRDDAEALKNKVDSLREVTVDDRPLVDSSGIPRDVAEETAQTLRDTEGRVRELGVVWRMAMGPEGS